jgi:hypothetical protein
MRASDGDRETVAGRLRDAHAEGRLTMEEVQERLDATYAAKTLGELALVTRDLPTEPPGSATGLAQRSGAEVEGRWHGMKAIWGSWASAALVTTVIWALTDPGGYFWPIWVAGPWGAVLLARTLFGEARERPGRRDDERDHR